MLLLNIPRACLIVALMVSQVLAGVGGDHAAAILCITTVVALDTLAAFPVWTLIGDTRAEPGLRRHAGGGRAVDSAGLTGARMPPCATRLPVERHRVPSVAVVRAGHRDRGATGWCETVGTTSGDGAMAGDPSSL